LLEDFFDVLGGAFLKGFFGIFFKGFFIESIPPLNPNFSDRRLFNITLNILRQEVFAILDKIMLFFIKSMKSDQKMAGIMGDRRERNGMLFEPIIPTFHYSTI
jgi:hypothetical protein